MLRELHISNLAIIESADIEFAPGLNAVTGQTGAGKSLIIGAFELLLGIRGGGAEDAATMVRPGAEEARVSGLFEIADQQTLAEVGALLDMPISPGDGILITRRVFASGRTSVSINGRPATATMLRQASQLLVDIHGQHDQQYLLRPANQLSILDEFCKCIDLRVQFGESLEKLRNTQARHRELTESLKTRLEQIELHRFQIDEIDQASPQAGEYEQLKQKFSVLSNIGKLKEQSDNVSQSLEDSEGAVLEQLARLAKTMNQLAAMDSAKLSPIKEQMQAAESILQDVARDLRSYSDNLELEPGELEKTQERMDLLNHIIHKYSRFAAAPVGGDPVDGILEYRQRIGRELATLESADDELAGMEQEIGRLGKQIAELGGKLSKERRKGAERIKPLVEEQLKELGMAEARFDIQIDSLSPDDLTVGPSGLDVAEFMVRTNPGQEFQPLRKIASGGEISRIMLAIKGIFAAGDRISVLVFDEIDSNVGDRLGEVIGRKLRELSGVLSAADKSGAKGTARKTSGQSPRRNCQIICITHLSQIAARANHHIRVAKQVLGKGKDQTTVTLVETLDGDRRVQEIAEMMAGAKITPAVLEHASQLLKQ